MHHCSACKSTAAVELRMDNQDTAFGPAMRLVCKGCYAKDCAERRAEGKRLHYRPKIVPWERLGVVQEGPKDQA
jgi:hypothetical protein